MTSSLEEKKEQDLLRRARTVLEQNGEVFSGFFVPGESNAVRRFFLTCSLQEQGILQRAATAEALLAA